MRAKEYARIFFMFCLLVWCVWRLYCYTSGGIGIPETADVATGCFAGMCYTLLGVASINTIGSSMKELRGHRRWRWDNVQHSKN